MVFATPKNAAKGLAKLIAGSAADAIKARGAFTLVLSGGSVLTTLGALADEPSVKVSSAVCGWGMRAYGSGARQRRPLAVGSARSGDSCMRLGLLR